MLQGWVVVAVALGYIGLLFVVASYGDRVREFGRTAAADLSAVARDLLHVVDVLRLGRPRLAHRLRLPHHLHRPDPDDRARPAADPAGRAARQGAEHHLDRRLHRRALRQGPGGRRDRRADRDPRHHPLHRAAAQGGVGVAQHHPRPHRRRLRHGAAGVRRHRAVRRAVDGGVRRAVRHPPHRRHRAPGRPDAGDRGGVDRQAGRLRRGRRVRDVLDVRRPDRAVHAGDGAARHRRRADARAADRHADRDDAAVVRRDPAAAAAVPRHGGREQQRGARSGARRGCSRSISC